MNAEIKEDVETIRTRIIPSLPSEDAKPINNVLSYLEVQEKKLCKIRKVNKIVMSQGANKSPRK